MSSPQNVLVGGRRRRAHHRLRRQSARRGRLVVTEDGGIRGKLRYMAPEQLKSGTQTRQVDIYAAARCCGDARRGTTVSAKDEATVIATVLHGDLPVSTRRPGSRELDAIIARSLSSDVTERHATASEMAAAPGARACASLDDVAAFVRDPRARSSSNVRDSFAPRRRRTTFVRSMRSSPTSSETRDAGPVVVPGLTTARPVSDPCHRAGTKDLLRASPRRGDRARHRHALARALSERAREVALAAAAPVASASLVPQLSAAPVAARPRRVAMSVCCPVVAPAPERRACRMRARGRRRKKPGDDPRDRPSAGTLPLVLVGALLAPASRRAGNRRAEQWRHALQEAKALLAQGRFELACQRFAEQSASRSHPSARSQHRRLPGAAGQARAAHASCLAAHDLAVRSPTPIAPPSPRTARRSSTFRIGAFYLELPEPNAKDLLVTLDDAPSGTTGGAVPSRSIRACIICRRPRLALDRRARVSVSASEREVRVKMPPFAEPAPSAGRPALSDVSEPRPAPEAEPRANLALPRRSSSRAVSSRAVSSRARSRSRGWDGFLEQCPDRKCATQAVKDAASSDHDAASFFATTSTVLCAGGIAFAALGAYFHYFHDDRHARIVPAVGLRTAGAQLDFCSDALTS